MSSALQHKILPARQYHSNRTLSMLHDVLTAYKIPLHLLKDMNKISQMNKVSREIFEFAIYAK